MADAAGLRRRRSPRTDRRRRWSRCSSRATASAPRTGSAGSGRRTGLAYIVSADGGGRRTGCPFCRIPTLPDEDGLVVARGGTVYAVLNLHPYNPGHLMVVPYRHVPD